MRQPFDLTCRRCGGTGRKDGTTRATPKCPMCKGVGFFLTIEEKRSAEGRPRQMS